MSLRKSTREGLKHLDRIKALTDANRSTGVGPFQKGDPDTYRPVSINVGQQAIDAWHGTDDPNELRVKSAFDLRNGDHVGRRVDVENDLFGYHPNTPASERPIYGAQSGSTDRLGGAQGYGEYFLTLNRNALNRTTFTPEDSFSARLTPKDLHSYENRHEAMNRANHHTYIEAQIHGGVYLPDDVECLHAGNFGSSNIDKLVQLGKRLGIPVYNHRSERSVLVHDPRSPELKDHHDTYRNHLAVELRHYVKTDPFKDNPKLQKAVADTYFNTTHSMHQHHVDGHQGTVLAVRKVKPDAFPYLDENGDIPKYQAPDVETEPSAQVKPISKSLSVLIELKKKLEFLLDIRSPITVNTFDPEDLEKMSHPTPSFKKLGFEDRRETPIVSTETERRSKVTGLTASYVNGYAPGSSPGTIRVPIKVKRVTTMGDADREAVKDQISHQLRIGAAGASARSPVQSSYSLSNDMRFPGATGDVATQLHEDSHNLFNRVESKHGRNARKLLAYNLLYSLPADHREELEVTTILHGYDPKAEVFHEECIANLMNFLNNPKSREDVLKSRFGSKASGMRGINFSSKMKEAHRYLMAAAETAPEHWLHSVTQKQEVELGTIDDISAEDLLKHL